MTILTKKTIGSFLSLVVACSGSMVFLNSCFSNPEEPVIETPSDEVEDPETEEPSEVEPPKEDPKEDETPSEDPKEDDNNSEEENPGKEDPEEGNNDGSLAYDEVPAGFLYPLSYVALPDGTPEQVKEYTGFTLNFNKDNHTANYVAWELLKSETSGSVNRNDYNYWVDNSIEGCLSTDFAYSTYSYERGHLCPAADQKWSTSAMSDCMVMANMSPQLRSLNSGLWGTLENNERTWAKRDGALWIIAGPLYYDVDDLYIGKAKARVPSAYFKAFLYIDTDSPRAIAFILQNGSNPGNLSDYAMSIDDLEEETGFDFFSALPDEIENAVEATFNYSDWQ